MARHGHGHGLGGALNDYPCGGTGALWTWLRHPDVKEALNAPKTARFFSGDNGVGFPYSITERNLMPFYQEVNARPGFRVLVC